MKSLSVKLGVIIFGIGLIFGYMEVWGADWKLYGPGQGDKGIFFYDAESITNPSKNIVRVWTKMVYTDKGIIDVVKELGDCYKNLEYSLNLVETNCADRKRRFVAVNYYSKDGEVLLSAKDEMVAWRYVPPDLVMEVLYKALCK